MMEACLAANNNEIDAVISENDSMATGVVAALDAVGLAGTVPVTGQDGDDPALNRVALGTQLVSVWKDAFALGQTAGEVAVQLADGVALEDIVAPDDLQDHVAPEAGVEAQPFTTPGGIEVQSIVLKPTPDHPGQPEPRDRPWLGDRGHRVRRGRARDGGCLRVTDLRLDSTVRPASGSLGAGRTCAADRGVGP